MDTRKTLLAAALSVLEREGEAQFSTRAVCALANVTAPTLYHHFGSADGLLSAAVAEAFAQFLAGKRAIPHAADAETGLARGWDNYVQFAAERPHLYAAMAGRVLQGAKIPAADQARALLLDRIAAIGAEGRLAMDAEAAADLAWASAHAAALLYVTAPARKPNPRVIAGLRDSALQAICKPKTKAKKS